MSAAIILQRMVEVLSLFFGWAVLGEVSILLIFFFSLSLSLFFCLSLSLSLSDLPLASSN